jgi:hypothetical protein
VSDNAWLEDVKTKWLRVCGQCDAGVIGAPCTHPDEDYRPVMLKLVETVERLSRRLALRYQESEKLRAEVEQLCNERDEARRIIRNAHQAIRTETTAAAVALAMFSTGDTDTPSLLDELNQLRTENARLRELAGA